MRHEEALDLLSWYATGALEAQEAAAVEAHVVDCEDCSAELAQLRLLHVAVAEDGPEEASYRPELVQEALSQIERAERAERTERTGLFAGMRAALDELAARLSWGATPAFARYALVGQLALVVGLAAVLVVREPGTPTYGVLSGGAGTTDARPQYGLVFAPGVSEAEMRSLLLEAHAEIVAGPSSLGLYTIAVSEDEDAAAVVAQLRESGQITYLEPVPGS